jgi:hypothetical protein
MNDTPYVEENDTIVVFTAKSPDRIIRDGGSQAWVLNAARARSCKWLLCTQNRRNRDANESDATEPHGAAFLIGEISAIRPAIEAGRSRPQRWMIEISRFARIQVPGAWDHGRNPVRYESLADMKIETDTLDFEPMPSRDWGAPAPFRQTGLSIAEAKQGLAWTFGVKEDAIEITIRG